MVPECTKMASRATFSLWVSSAKCQLFKTGYEMPTAYSNSFTIYPFELCMLSLLIITVIRYSSHSFEYGE
jgi:hypothetical protein